MRIREGGGDYAVGEDGGGDSVIGKDRGGYWSSGSKTTMIEGCPEMIKGTWINMAAFEQLEDENDCNEQDWTPAMIRSQRPRRRLRSGWGDFEGSSGIRFKVDRQRQYMN